MEPGLYPINDSLELAKKLEKDSEIDAIENLKGKKVFIYHALNDTLIP
jgi:hypothetical protein